VAQWWECILRFALVLWIVRVPLATTVFGIVLLGATPQAQDLFVEFAHPPPVWRALSMLWFLVVLTAVWAMPTHYAARMLLDTDSRFQEALHAEERSHATRCLALSSRCVPRALGLLTFFTVEFAILRSYMNRPTSNEPEVTAAVDWALVEVALLVAVAAAGYWAWVLKRPHRLNPTGWLRSLNEKLGVFWQIISPGRVRGSIDEESRDVGRFILSAIFVIFVGIFWLGAERVGAIFPRAMAVPFILGGWLPFLSYLSGVGRQIRAPLIAGLFGLVALLATVLGDNHSVRRIAADNVPPLALQDAVDLWMTENHCNPKSSAAAAAAATMPCPRPVIIAAAGGASRAAFFMATVIGYFMQEAPSHGLDPDKVRERLFAISSVSGGSVGAVMVTAALNAETAANEHPCVNTSVDQWWGDTVGNWRDCFEALTSGDFLTGDFFGFAFNDMLPFWLWRDRAAVLEDSWRNRYRDVAAAASKSATPPSCQGLECPFLTLRPRPGHWIPLLVLNGASEATGGRIVTTSLATTYTTPNPCPTTAGQGPCPLFVEADRFHDLLNADVTADRWWGWLGGFERYQLRDTNGSDIRLSTAAHNSARFPLISPPGSIRNNEQMVVDRIVDGGYFENYGALGAKELALAVHAVQPQLAPLVIVISNDPNDPLGPGDDAVPDQPNPPRPQVDGGEFITDATAPVTTFANARTAHGILGVDELRSTLRAAIPDCAQRMIQVRVWPDNGKPLSMSWWESSLMQRQMHRQTEVGTEKNQNSEHLDAIWTQLKAKSNCAP